MKITEHEMRGLLAGKCLPGDMRVNEDLSSYLARKFDELQQKLDAMAAENAVLKDINAWCHTEAFQNMYREFKTAEAIGCPDVDCMHDAMLVAIVHAPPSPATDAYLNSVRAEGSMAARNHIRKALTAFHYEHHGVVAECADMAEMVAQRLRHCTHDNADKAG